MIQQWQPSFNKQIPCYMQEAEGLYYGEDNNVRNVCKKRKAFITVKITTSETFAILTLLVF